MIAATNRDLERDVAEGRFRRDLYFRLRVLEIIVLPLRKRPEDIAGALPRYFLQKFNAETGRKLARLHPAGDGADAQVSLAGQRPRAEERRRAGRRAARGEFIEPDDLTLSKLATSGDTGEHASSHEFKPASLADVERQHILATLTATGWNKSQTAALLGIERHNARPQDLAATSCYRDERLKRRRTRLSSWTSGASGLQRRIFRPAHSHQARLPWKTSRRIIGRTGHGDYGHGLDLVWNDLPGVELVAVADDNKMGLAAKAKQLKRRARRMPTTGRCSMR